MNCICYWNALFYHFLLSSHKAWYHLVFSLFFSKGFWSLFSHISLLTNDRPWVVVFHVWCKSFSGHCPKCCIVWPIGSMGSSRPNHKVLFSLLFWFPWFDGFLMRNLRNANEGNDQKWIFSGKLWFGNRIRFKVLKCVITINSTRTGICALKSGLNEVVRDVLLWRWMYNCRICL